VIAIEKPAAVTTLNNSVLGITYPRAEGVIGWAESRKNPPLRGSGVDLWRWRRIALRAQGRIIEQQDGGCHYDKDCDADEHMEDAGHFLHFDLAR
jgi:hypothetical protein